VLDREPEQLFVHQKLQIENLFVGQGWIRIRFPSWSTLRSSARADNDLGPRATEDGAAERRGLRECGVPELRLEPLNWRLSGFGLRIPSDFELCP
jgi:hypothetical protein